MKRETKLYNVMFPIWFLMLLPITWLVVIPANFFIDLLVLFLTMKLCKMPDIGRNLKSVILKSWLMGFVADLIGTGGMFLAAAGGDLLPDPYRVWFNNQIGLGVMMNPFSSVGSFLWTAFFYGTGGIFHLPFQPEILPEKNHAGCHSAKKTGAFHGDFYRALSLFPADNTAVPILN